MDHIRVAKIPGGSLAKSFVVEGMVVPRDTLGVEKRKTKAKVVVYGNGVEFQQTEAKGTVLLENAEQLMNYSKALPCFSKILFPFSSADRRCFLRVSCSATQY